MLKAYAYINGHKETMMIKAFKALSGTKKFLWGIGILLAPLFIIGAVSPTPDMQKVAQVNQTATDAPLIIDEAESATLQTSEPQVMKVQTKSVTEVQPIPFQSTIQEDASLEVGKTVITTAGVNGEKVVTYSVTYTGNSETNRTQVSEHVTKAPINEVKSLGTKSKMPATAKPPGKGDKCDPNYGGACVPIASDVDCRGGTGKGPAFVTGPVRVIGHDIYRLDLDGNGIGCE